MKRTCGLPPDPVAETPPFASAVTLEQERISTSSSLGLYPASGTSHFGDELLPPFVSSASRGGFETASVDPEGVYSFTCARERITRQLRRQLEQKKRGTKDDRVRTGVVRNLLFAATAALRAPLSFLTCCTSGLSSK